MRLLLAVGMIVALSAAFPAAAQQPPASQPAASHLTPADTAAGWKVLFDGQNTGAWRGYRQKAFPSQGWTVTDGCLKTVAGVAGSDLITADQYGDFELTLEWKVTAQTRQGGSSRGIVGSIVARRRVSVSVSVVATLSPR